MTSETRRATQRLRRSRRRDGRDGIILALAGDIQNTFTFVVIVVAVVVVPPSP